MNKLFGVPLLTNLTDTLTDQFWLENNAVQKIKKYISYF